MRGTWGFGAIMAAGFVGCATPPPARPEVQLAAPVEAPARTRTAPAQTIQAAPDMSGLFGMIVDTPRGKAWVIDPSFGTAPTGAGEVALEDHVFRIASPASLDQVTPDLRLTGRRVALYDGSKKQCEVTAGRLVVVSQVAESFVDMMLDAEGERDPAAAKRDPLRLQKMATPWLAVELGELDGCGSVEWGRLAALTPPTFAEEITDFDAEPAFAALFAGPLSATHQRAYDAHELEVSQRYGATQRIGTWHSDPHAERAARAYVWRGQRHVLARVTVGESCSFRATARAAFRLEGDALRLVEVDESLLVDGTLVDLDADGQLEVIHDRRVTGLDESSWAPPVTPTESECDC